MPTPTNAGYRFRTAAPPLLSLLLSLFCLARTPPVPTAPRDRGPHERARQDQQPAADGEAGLGGGRRRGGAAIVGATTASVTATEAVRVVVRVAGASGRGVLPVAVRVVVRVAGASGRGVLPKAVRVVVRVARGRRVL